MEELYRELAHAVVWQAAFDYKINQEKAVKCKSELRADIARCEMDKIERFFCSERFKAFCDFDGREALEIIKKMKGNPFKKRIKGVYQ